MTRGTRTAPTAPVAPVFVGPDNSLAAVGISWRESLALARSLGVPVVRVGARQLVSARALLEALERRSVATSEVEAPADPEATVLRRLGRSV